MKPPLYDEKRLAMYIGCNVRKLQEDRRTGKGIPYVKVGRLARYRPEDVEEWLARNVRTSTSEA